jgi:hypothetical protein
VKIDATFRERALYIFHKAHHENRMSAMETEHLAHRAKE